MTVVADVAGESLKKDVAFVRSADRSRAGSGRGAQRCCRAPLTVDAAVQVALLNNKGLQAAYNELALAEGRSRRAEPAAQSDIFDFAHLRRRRQRDRTPGRRRYPRARDPAVPLRHRAGPFPAGPAQGGAGDAAARRRRPPRLFSRRSPPTRSSGLLTDAKATAEATAQLATEARRDRRDQQARSGTRAGLLRRDHRGSRDRASGRDELARAARAPDGLVGQRSRLPASRPAAAAAAPAIWRCPPSRPMPSATASTCRSRAWNWSALAKSLDLDRGDALRHAARRRRHRPDAPAIPNSRALPRARLRRPVPDSDLRRRRGAGPAGGRDLQPGFQPPDRNRPSTCAREARDAYRVYRSTYDIANHYQREVLPLRKIITEEMQLRFSEHAGRRVRPADGGAAAHRLPACGDRRQARILPGAVRSADRVNGGGAGETAEQATAQIGRGRTRGRRQVIEGRRSMFSRRGFLGTAALAGASAVSGRVQAAAIPEAPTMDKAVMQPPLHPTSGPDYRPVVTLERLVAAMAHERRLEGIPSRRRACGARIRRRHEGEPVGLQRPGAGPDHRGGRGRQGSHLRHQQAARAHHRALARHDRAERHGRRRRTDPAAHQARQDLRLRVRAEEKRDLHVPPALRRDGADGDGHDGHVHRAPARSVVPSRRPRLRLRHEHLSHRSRHLLCRRSTR